jgi:hypothetical protein
MRAHRSALDESRAEVPTLTVDRGVDRAAARSRAGPARGSTPRDPAWASAGSAARPARCGDVHRRRRAGRPEGRTGGARPDRRRRVRRRRTGGVRRAHRLRRGGGGGTALAPNPRPCSRLKGRGPARRRRALRRAPGPGDGPRSCSTPSSVVGGSRHAMARSSATVNARSDQYAVKAPAGHSARRAVATPRSMFGDR